MFQWISRIYALWQNKKAVKDLFINAAEQAEANIYAYNRLKKEKKE